MLLVEHIVFFHRRRRHFEMPYKQHTVVLFMPDTLGPLFSLRRRKLIYAVYINVERGECGEDREKARQNAG